MPRFRRSRLGMLTMVLVALAFVASGAADRMLVHWAYAVEKGKRQADSDELANVLEVSRAFRMVARLAQPAVVQIRVRSDEGVLAQLERLGERLLDARKRLEEIEKLLGRDLRGELDGDEVFELLDEQALLGKRSRELRNRLESLHERTASAAGSGIIIDERGHILTNNHVIDGRSNIEVRLHDGRELQAVPVGADPKSDLAVIRIDAPDLHTLSFGDSDAAEVGDWVLAVGAPFGLSHTVTHGIISAKGRTDIAVGREIAYKDFIQTDAAINPGNSGGPLLNLRGEIIGINTAIATNGDAVNSGVAFTIPSNMARRIAQQLISSGSVARGWLGISMLPVSEEDAESLHLDRPMGAMVNFLYTDSPAHKAGLMCEDIIVAVDGEKVRDLARLRALIADVMPGDTTKLLILRDGAERAIEVALGRQPDDIGLYARRRRSVVTREVASLRLQVRSLRRGLPRTVGNDDNLAIASRIFRHERGVVVYESGWQVLAPGDLIVSADRESISTVADLMSVLHSDARARTVELEIVDVSGDRRTVELKRTRIEE